MLKKNISAALTVYGYETVYAKNYLCIFNYQKPIPLIQFYIFYKHYVN